MASGVQEQEVWQAADALLMEGEQPTIERVRLKLGRGSPNTVGPMLKTWFRNLGARLAGQQQQFDAPEPVVQAVTQVWAMALETAQSHWAQTMAEERLALVQARSALDEREHELLQERLTLQARAEELQARARDALALTQAADARLAEAQSQLRDALTQARIERTELTKAQQALEAERKALADQMHEQATSHAQALAAEQERHAAHERRWLVDLDAQRQAARKAQEEIEAVRAEQVATRNALSEALAEVRRVEGALTQAQGAARSTLREQQLEWQAERASLQAQLAASQGLADRVEGQAQRDIAAASTLQAMTQARVDDLGAQVSQLQAQLAGRDRQIEQLLGTKAPDEGADKTTSGEGLEAAAGAAAEPAAAGKGVKRRGGR
ncbi:DNA-binding protein [Pseudomonadota bacterium AL_CKDN230030165-1A_HGKHYDSX7]